LGWISQLQEIGQAPVVTLQGQLGITDRVGMPNDLGGYRQAFVQRRGVEQRRVPAVQRAEERPLVGQTTSGLHRLLAQV